MSEVSINEALNLVVPVGDGKGTVLCPPLSREAFSSCWSLLARTWSRLEAEDLGITAGGAVAAHALADIARQSGPEEQEKHRAFLAELRRNASYIGPMGDDGFGPVPLGTALQRGWIGEDERDELENILVFFTLGSRLLPRARRQIIFRLMLSLRTVAASSLNATEYAASAATSQKGAPIGGTEGASSPPSSTG